jgi:hypothetical protein
MVANRFVTAQDARVAAVVRELNAS